MSDFPLVIVKLMTYAPEDRPERLDYALRTIEAVNNNLIYPEWDWHIADAGSSGKNLERIMDATPNASHDIIKAPEGTSHIGNGWNHAIRTIYDKFGLDLYLRLEDDWILHEQFDITRHVKTFDLDPNVGMIRFGYQHVPHPMTAIGIGGLHYLRYEKSKPYAYGGHPALIHRRLHDAYGYFHEGKNPGDIETEFDERVRATENPNILRPQDIGGWGTFNHIGEKKGYG